MVVARIKRREELMWQPQLSSKGEQTDVAWQQLCKREKRKVDVIVTIVEQREANWCSFAAYTLKAQTLYILEQEDGPIPQAQLTKGPH